MQVFLRKGGETRLPITPEFSRVGDKIVASAPWVVEAGRRSERFMVFTVAAEKIVDMQGFASRREAEKFARLP